MRGDPTVTFLAHCSVKSQVRSCNHPAGPAPRTELQRIAGRNDLMSLDGDDGEVASGGGTNALFVSQTFFSLYHIKMNFTILKYQIKSDYKYFFDG